jgi:hypothetical protein
VSFKLKLTSIVVVHGLYGARRPPWKNEGSGDSGWMDTKGTVHGRKLMSFGYSASTLLASRYTRQAIRATAISLLEGLKAERAKVTAVRESGCYSLLPLSNFSCRRDQLCLSVTTLVASLLRM